jgi:hypothetical protein
MAKKDFKIVDLKLDYVACEKQRVVTEMVPPRLTMVKFPVNGSNSRTHDFGAHYCKGCDYIVYAIQRTVEHMLSESVESGTLTVTTIVGYCKIGLAQFLPFCQLVAAALKRDLTLDDIDKGFVERFIGYLAEGKTSKVSQKSTYSQAKSILVGMCKLGWLTSDQREIFPRNPFPNSNRLAKGQKAFSSPELGRLTKALADDLRRIKNATEPLDTYELVVCMLAIAARTGINPTPLIKLQADCLQPHPLKHDRRLLVSFKRRGNTTHITSLRKSDDIALINTVMMDVAAIIDLVKKRNQGVREGLGSARLFVCLNKKNDTTLTMTNTHLAYGIKLLIDRHDLCCDDGRQLQLNVSRLRKSFINRIWRLSGHDPIVTAALGHHCLTVSNDHYLEAPPEAEKNFSLLGEVRVKELLDSTQNTPTSNTPVGKCKDSLHGHRAPKNGEHCTDFLACFRCKSFVVTEDDLYRVISLYWLLVAERKNIGAKRWSRYYAHIIRIIDTDILPQFNVTTVTELRLKAAVHPHPYWSTTEFLSGSLV